MGRSILFVIALSVVCASASSGARVMLGDDREVDVVKQPGSFCQGCRSIVSFMSRFNSSVRRDENKELFERFCETYYPVSTDFRLGPCPMFVEGMFNVLNRIDPVNQCDDIGACGNIEWPITVPVEQEQGPDGPVCNFCTEVVSQVQGEMEDPRLIDDVRKKVDAFCEYLTVIDANKQCRAALESYVDQALAFIRQAEPKDLCRSIHLCRPPSPPAVRITATESKMPPSLADFNDFGIETSVLVGAQQVKSIDMMGSDNLGIKSPNCMFCKAFVKEMFKFLRENRTEESVRNALDSVCGLIYHDKDKLDHCEDLVKAYSKELIELLVDETNPEVICMLLEQCTFQTMKPKTRGPAYRLGEPMSRQRGVANKPLVTMSQLISMLDPTIQVGSMRSCIECKLFIKYIQETLQEKTSQDEIKDWLLNNLCQNMGDRSLAESCTNLINQESAIFFKAVVESLNPEKSCEYLGACSAHIRSEYLAQLKQQLEAMRPESTTTTTTTSQPLVGALCDQCVEVVTKIDDYLSAHPIDHDIAVLKDKVCNTIEDSNLRGECVMIIQIFGQEIIQAISNMDSPQQLCSKIRLCKASLV